MKLLICFCILSFCAVISAHPFETVKQDSNLIRSVKCISPLQKYFNRENEICKYEIAVLVTEFAKKEDILLTKPQKLALENIIKNVKQELGMLGITLKIIKNKLMWFSNTHSFVCSAAYKQNEFKKTILFEKKEPVLVSSIASDQ